MADPSLVCARSAGRLTSVKRMRVRDVVWALVLIGAIFRPGIDRFDRWLAGPFWDIPSQWNVVADVAIQTRAVDDRLDGMRAPWRQASVFKVVGDSRIAIVTVSDLRRSRATWLDADYKVLGQLSRATSIPELVTDETRGYKPLTHLWPILWQDGRLLTLVTFAPLYSNPPTDGLFAYIALGAEDNELLFVCRLRWGAASLHGMLGRDDVNGDGFGDLIFYNGERQDVPPLGVFIWHQGERRYVPRVTEDGRQFVRWWSTSPNDRVLIRRDQPIDDAVRGLEPRLQAVDAAR
jgi:hypothetical protein